MKAIKLDELFVANRADYKAMATEAYAFTAQTLRASKEAPRQDDVAGHLQGYIELDNPLKVHLSKWKKTQQYWPKYFAFLILDRLWKELQDEYKPG